MLIQPTPAVIRSRGRALSTVRPQPLQAREPQPLQAREHRSALGSRLSMLRSSPDAAELCAVCKSSARGARDWLVHLYALTLACPQSSGSRSAHSPQDHCVQRQALWNSASASQSALQEVDVSDYVTAVGQRDGT